MKFLLTAILALVLIPTANAKTTTYLGNPTVELLTTSAFVSTQDLENGLPAWQASVSQNLARYWGTDANLIVGDPAHPSPADMTLLVSDKWDCTLCLGYHQFTNKHQPYGKIFIDPHEDWTLVLSHELNEMIVDPYLDYFQNAKGHSWIVEVADPVESGYYGYQINGVWMSDFITPAWYGGKGPLDFTNHLKRHMQIGRHGFASWFDGLWHYAEG